MWIRSVRLRNYKSFLDSGPIVFEQGLNVITGKNSAGKTSLLEALQKLTNVPHRSLATIPKEGQSPKGTSNLEFELRLSSDDVELLLMEHSEFYLPEANNGEDPLPQMLRQREITLKGLRSTTGEGFRQLDGEFGVSLGYTEAHTIPSRSVRYQSSAGEIHRHPKLHQNVPTPLTYLAPGAFSSIYYFHAQRYNLARAQIGASTVLVPNASNLAEVLLNLAGTNPERFKEYNALVSEVFPEIRAITVAPFPQAPSSALIRVWFIDPATKRGDLAFSLDECGTGVSQVLAILYVALTSLSPRVIVIDEPQSFLHPGAARKLLEILQSTGREHQYIISTHWPGAVTSIPAATVHTLRLDDMQSRASAMNQQETAELSRCLLDLGARLSDVFGADQVVWVEGPTEEVLFPRIVGQVLEKRLGGTQILGVIHTGDFERRHRISRRTIWEVYGKVSSGSALTPPAIGFIFDREGRTAEEQAALAKESSGRVRFLPRRMLENYLLHPKAIAAVLSHLLQEEISTAAIEAALAEKAGSAEVLDTDARRMMSDGKSQEESVHGARLLEAVFFSATRGRVDFDKVRDSPAIGQWLIDHDPSQLAEVSSLLEAVLETKAGK